MATNTLQPANPNYFDQPSSRPHTRRNSSRKSFASTLSRTGSHVDLPRTPCPKDGDAFSYHPSHLHSWYLPQELWDRLPAELQSALAAVQHSGAAVLTGKLSQHSCHVAVRFERLEKHTGDTGSGRPDHKLAEDELLVQFEDLPPPKYRTISNASSALQSDISSPFYCGSSASQSGSTSPAMSSFSVGHPAIPCSPMSLGPPKETFADMRGRSRDRSFSTPLDPHEAYYATELSHLRTEATPRLRHLGRKVDTEWYEAKRTGNVAAEDVNTFENWWADKKCSILSLNYKGKRLAAMHGVSSSGMGWSAP
ncbi:hypothetical protein P153DRAFT_298491 [Dothidotthia symphoricarpi CBS 119687]|uniref:Uncharacterized protein n=1 Tax=Dothidotthia symphoricarpi CBS 119687 TaxID=1392245 RepID=A0A6A6A4I0_9PLEO|nr:uncharacterized protein P153DRAFT_298491 [Dothidotthia symphoricarpi CBS 119687]KAF2126024.1 hypothetical protein P153DRAFT_298491 [Dothidotthia symphoricarpi CBS 119687]